MLLQCKFKLSHTYYAVEMGPLTNDQLNDPHCSVLTSELEYIVLHPGPTQNTGLNTTLVMLQMICLECICCS
mgnify:CR=1 FL=1